MHKTQLFRADPLSNMELHFKTREDAIAYAETQGITLYELIQVCCNLNIVYIHWQM